MKFGGTSVGSPDRVRVLGETVRQRLKRQPVVVVSAFSRVTDTLIRGARLALAGAPEHDEIVNEIRRRHQDAVAELLPAGPEHERLLALVDQLTGELRTLYTGVRYLGELTPRSLDAISAMGERLSHEIVASALADAGVPARAVDARDVIVTDESFGRAQPLHDEIEERVADHVRPLLDAGAVPVLAGFIGATLKGATTTLGRGGSDWSASLVGAALPAEEIQIWTDVDGMLTADPRVVSAARLIPEVSFEEAAELAYFGAKVLHPASIRPAVERGIPVVVLNSFDPQARGTRITRNALHAVGEPRAFAFKKGITVLIVSQPRMLMAHGFLARIFEAFDRHRTPVDLIATSEVSVSLTVDDPARLDAVRAELALLGEVQQLGGMAIVSVVGRGFTQRPGLAARVFDPLRDVNVLMISFGASDVNVSFVVAEADAERAVRQLHQAFFEREAARA
ncbi:MAG: lysine-sensitive aspartokinase 3 [Vicinamibacteria bacterium]